MQLTLKLDENARRPVIKLDWFNGCRALLDTGALLPVWTANGGLLQQLGAKLIKENVTFGGFGGNAQGALYRIDFQLGNLIFKDMPIVATNMKDLNCHLILPATLFDRMIYEIDTINYALNIDTKDNQLVRILRVSDDRGKFSVYLAGTYETVEDYENSEDFPLNEDISISIVDENGKELSENDLIDKFFCDS